MIEGLDLARLSHAPDCALALPLYWITLPDGQRLNLCLVREARPYHDAAGTPGVTLVMAYGDGDGHPVVHEIAGDIGQRILSVLQLCTVPL